jgi:hypothetical protein
MTANEIMISKKTLYLLHAFTSEFILSACKAGEGCENILSPMMERIRKCHVKLFRD